MGKSFDSFDFGGLKVEESYEEKKMKEIEEELRIPISAEENIDRVIHNKPGAFFVDGPGGTGKTFLYSTLLANLRAQGIIALAVATSGIAASNIAGGRTANSRFKIPLDIDENQNPKFQNKVHLQS
ncbi:uncharacterized protein LOC104885081 [Beta vulgaris subsp. vulgaris]|uniref:uncharacterized protein LOC104885081 n=1 Tax=Beta vulgaris subsp. vulgaris TaxID=3555 RepID=UPI0025470F2C|nr:uncharacterized protein LOC104885081 [Beta vulgaris subsp. vulgaris]